MNWQGFPLISLTLDRLNAESVVDCHVFINGLDFCLIFSKVFLSFVQRTKIVEI